MTTLPTPPITASISNRKKLAGCLVQAGRILAILIAVLVLLAACGAAYESTARAQELRQVSAPGQLVDVGGHSLHLVCTGQKVAGQSTVVLESGVGGWSKHWHTVQPAVAPFARVCAYDRAGYGWSELGPRPRDGQTVAAELHTLLERAGEVGPYVLVGASRGGQYVRLFQAAYPGQVAGLVLVDAEPEQFRARSDFARNTAAQNQAVFSVLGTLSRLGVLRLLGGDPASVPELPCLPSLVKSLPAAEHAAHLAVEGQPRCYETVLAEDAATTEREAQVAQHGQPGALGDLPLVVIVRGRAVTGAPEAEQTEQIWHELQRELSGLSIRGTLIVAEESGHNIMLDQPAVVVDAIERMMD